MFGITTYYRREPDSSLSIKLEGNIDGVPLFDQVAVLREVDLHCKWAPFCSSSLTIAHLAKLDTVGWFVVGLPQFGLMRDACYRVLGTDSIQEDGSILLVGTGIDDRQSSPTSLQSPPKSDGAGGGTNETESSRSSERSSSTTRRGSTTHQHQTEFEYLGKDPILKELELPDVPTRMGSGRMTIRKFQAIIHVESPTLAKTKIIANIDPNLPLIPQSLLDFLMKKLCGVLLTKLQHAAKKVSKDPIYNPHACKMREEEPFYKHWLMPKFQAVCDLRGWQMPPVAAFELSEQQLDLADEAIANAAKKRNKGIKLYHSLSNDNLDDILENPDHPTNNNNHPSLHSAPANVGASAPTSGSGPRIRAMTDDSDTVSELSRNSSTTFWKNNPIATYMREVEEKTELRRARKIEKSRKKAAARLKPKELDQVSDSRLKELQAARQRRSVGVQQQKHEKQKNPFGDHDHKSRPRSQPSSSSLIYPTNATKSQRAVIQQEIYKRDWATFWTSHNLPTRIIVISFLFCFLFGSLYMDPLFDSYIITQQETFGDGVSDQGKGGGRVIPKLIFLRDVITIVYLCISACAHFVLCYVALMYAFSSLQIGSIAGREARRYYSENIHLVVGLSSGSMVVVGILRATVLTLCRWVIWKSLKGFDKIKDLLVVDFNDLYGFLGLAMPDSFESTIETISVCGGKISAVIGSISASVLNVLAVFLSWVSAAVFKSNFIGQSFLALSSAFVTPVHFALNTWNRFVDSSISFYEGGHDDESGSIDVPSWREDVYMTTRALLSYSAFFLLVVLVLFNMQAKSSRSPSSSSIAVEPKSKNESLEVDTRSCEEEKNPPIPVLSTPRRSGSGALSELTNNTNTARSDVFVSAMTSPPLKTRQRSLTKSLSPVFDTIQEGPEEGNGGTRSPISVGTPSSSSKKKKKKMGFLKISPAKTPRTLASSK